MGAGEEFAVRADGEAGAVEDERVVAADLVDHDDRNAVALGDGGEHVEADLALVAPVGRGGDVDDKRAGAFASLAHEFVDGIDGVEARGPEGLVVPGVFADGEGDAFAAEAEWLLAFGGREVALLVEDIVEGQEHLRLGELDLAVAQERGGISDALAASVLCGSDEAGDDGDGQRGGCGGDFLHGFSGAGDEGGFFEEIGGRIAADGEFGEDDEIGVGCGGLVGEIHDFGGVAVEIPDGGIDLCQRDLHCFSLAMRDRFQASLRYTHANRAEKSESSRLKREMTKPHKVTRAASEFRRRRNRLARIRPRRRGMADPLAHRSPTRPARPGNRRHPRPHRPRIRPRRGPQSRRHLPPRQQLPPKEPRVQPPSRREALNRATLPGGASPRQSAASASLGNVAPDHLFAQSQASFTRFRPPQFCAKPELGEN